MTTKPLQIKNTAPAVAFLVDQIGSVTPREQVIRELVENAKQACLNRLKIEPEMAGKLRIEIGIDKYELDVNRRMCLRIADNGIGIEAGQFQELCNTMLSSGQEQGLTANFGMGAKVAGMYHNPLGMRYCSWTPKGSMAATLYRDEAGTYGMKENSDGACIVEVPPELADGTMCVFTTGGAPRGTCVTLLGTKIDDHTALSDRGGTKYIVGYLRNRYFELDDRVQIVVRMFRGTPGIMPYEEFISEKVSQYRSCESGSDYVLANSDATGLLELDAARVFWSISPVGKARQVGTGAIANAKHALVFQGECYESREGARAQAELKRYGIVAGFNRVRLFIQPTMPDVKSNPSRTALERIGGLEMPHAEWQRQFQERMPQAIRDLIEDELGRMEPRSKQDFERILNLEWFRTPKYRPHATGQDEVAQSASGAPEFPENIGSDDPVAVAEHQPRRKPVKDPLDGGKPAIKRGEGVDAPEVRWVGEGHSDSLRGHAGEYVAVASGDVLYCNKDYRLFGDLVSTMRDSFPQHDERQIIEVIREQYEVTMVCLVVGWRKMKATRAVTDEGVLAAMIEPQAFSTAVLASYLTHHNNTIAALRKANPAMLQMA